MIISASGNAPGGSSSTAPLPGPSSEQSFVSGFATVADGINKTLFDQRSTPAQLRQAKTKYIAVYAAAHTSFGVAAQRILTGGLDLQNSKAALIQHRLDNPQPNTGRKSRETDAHRALRRRVESFCDCAADRLDAGQDDVRDALRQAGEFMEMPERDARFGNANFILLAGRLHGVRQALAIELAERTMLSMPPGTSLPMDLPAQTKAMEALTSDLNGLSSMKYIMSDTSLALIRRFAEIAHASAPAMDPPWHSLPARLRLRIEYDASEAGRLAVHTRVTLGRLVASHLHFTAANAARDALLNTLSPAPAAVSPRQAIGTPRPDFQVGPRAWDDLRPLEEAASVLRRLDRLGREEADAAATMRHRMQSVGLTPPRTPRRRASLPDAATLATMAG